MFLRISRASRFFFFFKDPQGLHRKLFKTYFFQGPTCMIFIKKMSGIKRTTTLYFSKKNFSFKDQQNHKSGLFKEYFLMDIQTKKLNFIKYHQSHKLGFLEDYFTNKHGDFRNNSFSRTKWSTILIFFNKTLLQGRLFSQRLGKLKGKFFMNIFQGQNYLGTLIF